MNRVLIFLMMAVLLGCERNPPSDAQLIQHFRNHRAEYERVLSVMAEKPLVTRIEYVKDLWGKVEVRTLPVQVDGERLHRLELFHSSTSVQVIDAAAAGEYIASADFVNYRSGVVGSGTAKGISYQSQPNFPGNESGAFLSQECLDKYTPPFGTDRFKKLAGTAYCRIDEHWYVFISQ